MRASFNLGKTSGFYSIGSAAILRVLDMEDIQHPDDLHRLGYLEVVLHIIGSVDGVHRRFHGFRDFPQFPLHCFFVKLIQIFHNSYFVQRYN